jgi:hypothetical protein
LAGDDDVAGFEGIDVVSVKQLGFVFRHGWRCATRVGGGEKHGLDQVEVFFGLHAVHQDRADHASPADQANAISDFFHFFALSIHVFLIPGSSGREGRDEPRRLAFGCFQGDRAAAPLTRRGQWSVVCITLFAKHEGILAALPNAG